MKTCLWNRSLPEKHWSFTSSPRIGLREPQYEDEILVGHYATHGIAAVSRFPVLAHNRSATRCAPALQRRDCFCGCDVDEHGIAPAARVLIPGRTHIGTSGENFCRSANSAQ